MGQYIYTANCCTYGHTLCFLDNSTRRAKGPVDSRALFTSKIIICTRRLEESALNNKNNKLIDYFVGNLI